METRHSNEPRGSVLIEALVAIGISAIVMMALLTLGVSGWRAADKIQSRHVALEYANEGLAAVRSMEFSDLTPMSTGALSFSSSTWSLASGSPEALPNGMTRIITVDEVQRDGSCMVVDSGTVDPDSFRINSEVIWTDVMGIDHAVDFSSHRTQWSAPEGSCFQPEQSANVTIDLSNVNWHGQKQLRNLYITNNGVSDVIVDEVTLTWDNGEEIDQMFIGAGKVWSASGPGTPTGSQLSGTELDIQDVTLTTTQVTEMHKVQFSHDMRGSTLTLKLEFSDDSSITVGPVTPAGS